MTDRQKFVELALSYNNVKQGSKKHKKLVDIFNAAKINAGAGIEKANYFCAWCAITATAIALMFGFKQKSFPMSYNCGRLIERAKKLGMWVEDDNHRPRKGDLVVYYWDASLGDCTFGSSHVGIVCSQIKNNTFEVFEGNKGTSKKSGIRTISVGWRYIRGFIKTTFPDEIESKPKNTPGVKFAKSVKYTVTADALNVRIAARKNCKKLDTFAKGYKFKCLEVKKDTKGNTWLRCDDGWVCGREGKNDYVK